MTTRANEYSHTEVFFPSLMNLRPTPKSLQPNQKKRRVIERLATKIQLKTVYLASCAMLIYYGLLAAVHPIFLEGLTGYIMSAIAAGTSLFGGVLATLIRLNKIRSQHAENLFLLIAILVVFNIFSHIHLTQEQIQLSLAVFLPCMFGVVCVSWKHFYCLSGVSISLYIFFAVQLPGEHTAHFLFLLLIGIVLGLLSYVPRANLLFFNLNALVENREQLRNLSRQKTDLNELYDRALEASRAKERFLQNVSHELRTPLNAIMGFTHLINGTDNPLNQRQKEVVIHIDEASHLLLGLVDDILQFTNVHEYERVLKIELLDPSIFVRSTVAMVANKAQKKSIKINVSPSVYGSLTKVYGDMSRCRQVLLILFSNAIKYSEHSTVVSIECQQTGNGFTRIAVADTGPGIPEEVQHRLFEAFDRLDKIYSDTRGMGLGLSTAKILVEQMGGHIGFASRVGDGSLFWFDLPNETTSSYREVS